MLEYLLLVAVGATCLCAYRYYRKRKEASRFDYLFSPKVGSRN